MSLVPSSQVAARVARVESRFEKLPDVLFNKVHAFLLPEDLASIFSTCRGLRAAADVSVRTLFRGIRECSYISDCYHLASKSSRVVKDYAQLFGIMPNLRSLTLSSESLHLVRFLQDGSPHSTRNLFKRVRTFTKQDILALEGVTVEILGFSRISQLTSLHVQGHNLGFSDESAQRIISGCPRLNTLTFSGCEELTDEGIRDLAKLKQLESVSFESCCRLSQRSAQVLAKTPSLTSVTVADGCVGIKHGSLDVLLDSPSLRRLSVGSFLGQNEGDQFRVMGVVAKKGRNLTHLSFKWYFRDITTWGAECLCEVAEGCKKLVFVDLSSFNKISSGRAAQITLAFKGVDVRMPRIAADMVDYDEDERP